MLRTSIYFSAIAIACTLLADIEVSTIDPWGETYRMLSGAVSPDLYVLFEFRAAFLNTITFAICGIFIGIVLGSFLALFFHISGVRLFCAFVRAIHEIFWAFIFLPVFGLNPVCGVLAIAVPYAGIFAKVYAEILQEADQGPLKGLPYHANPISKFFYGTLPLIFEDVKNYTSYRFECALRSSAILGFIGFPTLGFHLETAFREGMYSQAAALLYSFFFLVASLKYWLKPKILISFACLAFFLIFRGISFSWENLIKFITYDILPWPVRREGFLNGTYDIAFSFGQVWEWAANIIQTEALPGVWQTIILTQIVLVGAGIFALAGFPTLSRYFYGQRLCKLSCYLLLIIRTTPEYMLAYIFLQLLGPSMLPAILAMTLHNGAILAYLNWKNADMVKLRLDGPKKKINRYFFEILPRVYGQFLAFLFFRWEIIMRESAILGILGIYTLGFYIDSAISDDKLDKAIFLITVTALLNMVIDTISQQIRKRLKVSTSLITSY